MGGRRAKIVGQDKGKAARPELHHGRRLARFNGRQIGFTGNNGTLETDYSESIGHRAADPVQTGQFLHGSTTAIEHADFGQSLDPITSWSQGSAGGSYTVREGDTLQGIAAQLWGDASLWYKIAEANGMTAAAGLVQGQSLTIPVNLLKSGHNAGTFQPYDASQAMGQVSPTSPKPNRSNKCGVLGAVLLTVVSVAVSFVLPVVVPSIFAAGGFLGSVGGAVAASMIGSAVSQGVGLATGIQDKFSWKGVAVAGLSAAVGGGLGKVLGPAGVAGSKLLTDMVRGAAGSAIVQGVSVATGLQDKFDWAGVAAAGLGAAAGGAISRKLMIKTDPVTGELLERPTTWNMPDGFGHNAAVSAADAIGQATARSLVEGTSFGDNLLAALPSAIGNTIGNSIGRALGEAMRPQAAPDDAASSFEEEPSASDAPAASGSSGMGARTEPALGEGGGQICGSDPMPAAPSGEVNDIKGGGLLFKIADEIRPRFQFGPPNSIGSTAEPVLGQNINGYGYDPDADDVTLLARAIFAESASIPGDMPAIGWSIVNRVRDVKPIGQPETNSTLEGVLQHPGQFEFLPQGGGPAGGSPLWRLSGRPEGPGPQHKASWEQAQRVAVGILSGHIPDPTGRATFFFSSESYNGSARTAPGGFPDMIRSGLIVPSPFVTTSRGGNRNYFWVHRQDLPRRGGR